MNILRLSTLSLTLAIAVVTLGVSVNSWAAPDECKGKPELRPETCDEPDPAQTKYNVTITLSSARTDVFTCHGETKLTKLGVTFNDSPLPGQCQVMLDDGVLYCTNQIAVKNSRNAKAEFFYSDQCGIFPAPGSSTYEFTSDVLLQPPSGSSFQVTVEDKDQHLIKLTHPDKGLTLKEPISVGNIVYTAQQ